jgi:nitrate/nitrite transport system ATP-binding protein
MMITHDVDEAIYLADKIFLMTNGPNAAIAEVIENTLPRDRSRASLHNHPAYYPLRNHIVEFLISRSRTFRSENPGFNTRQVNYIRIEPRGAPVVRLERAAAFESREDAEGPSDTAGLVLQRTAR